MKNIQSKDELGKLLKTEKYLLIDFSAKWCGPCQSVKPILEWFENESEYEKLRIVSVDIDRFTKVADEYKVQMIPTLIFFEDGKPVKTFVGLPSLEALRKYVRTLLGLKTSKWLLGGWR